MVFSANLVRAFAWRVALLGAVSVALAPLGCGPSGAQEKPDDKPTTSPGPTAQPAPGSAAGEKVDLKLLFTTDEHGWLEPYMDRPAGMRRGGVVEAYDHLTKVEGLGSPSVALLSGGDMWTGPYETTVLEGKPMVEAFNDMGYRASAVGNHEFDFGLKVLERRAGEAGFPFLAANLREAASQERPSWCKSSTIIEVSGIKLGVVGMVYEHSPEATDPKNLVGLEFLKYEDVLQPAVEEVRAAGADEVVLIVHDRLSRATKLAPMLRELGVNLVAVGHAHKSASFVDTGGTDTDVSDDIIFCNAGAYLRSYCRMDVSFEKGKMSYRQVAVVPIQRPIADPIEEPRQVLVDIVQAAHAASEKVGGEILVKAPRAIRREDGALGQLIVDTWLDALPYAQAAVTNAGGIRQDLPKGKVRVRDVASVLPFNNYLLIVELTGAQLRDVVQRSESVQGGLRFTYRETPTGRLIVELTDKEGKAILDDQRYKVVINDFMYRGGDKYNFFEMDPNPEETAIDWREPLLRTLRTMGRENKKLEVVPDDRARLVE